MGPGQRFGPISMGVTGIPVIGNVGPGSSGKILGPCSRTPPGVALARVAESGLSDVHISVHLSMSKSYSVADARAHLPQILDDVEAGKEVQLTRRGQPVAVLLSPQRYEALRREHSNFGDAYRAFVGRHAPEEIGVEADFFESLRDREAGRRVRL